jgi:hypothetical protein
MAEVTPAVRNVRIKKGGKWSLVFDVDINGTILDLSAATVECQFREEKNLTSTLIITPTISVSVDDEITLSLTDLQTVDINPSEGYYDVWVTIGTERICYLEGKASFPSSVTVKS